MNNKKRTINKQQKKGIRLWVQIIFAALTNGYVNGFIQSKIYTGPTKALCVPGLNCYSCPGALGACPIGSLQAVISSRSYQFSFYIVGFLMAVGALSGRVVCGFLCPFGLVQDLLHKIPVPKLKTLPGEKYLKYLKYVILAVFVLLLPMFAVNIIGQGNPWFCKWICPSGTLLGGIPLTLGNPDLQAAIGRLFDWKVFLMVSILVFSMFAYRPFCRFLCPLGAVYGVFNPVSLYHLHLDEDKCVNCGICKKTCKMGIDPRETPNSIECIRCGDCVRACPAGALTKGFGIGRKPEAACSDSCASCSKSCGGKSV
ncbi:4Fe-4S binding protein [[Clostridium] hylemonae]|uniref:4Fe-4S binding protein n=1 Tax=[Clostridium] hylemonae TaxID=89153 RepID=UPI001FCB6554|nr:4Fe-4S binding protein [[Clostridium] hylemonae]BDF05767.1 4Fe-4S ferredoxin [[Clostridium] hylemonae]